MCGVSPSPLLYREYASRVSWFICWSAEFVPFSWSRFSICSSFSSLYWKGQVKKTGHGRDADRVSPAIISVEYTTLKSERTAFTMQLFRTSVWRNSALPEYQFMRVQLLGRAAPLPFLRREPKIRSRRRFRAQPFLYCWAEAAVCFIWHEELWKEEG